MILVTGGNGFIGRHVARRLAGEGEQVRVMVRQRSRYQAPTDVEVVQADVTRPETMGEAVAGVDKIVHTAAITGNYKEPYPGAYRDVHQTGTENLVAAAAGAGVGRIVLLSGLGTRPAADGTYMAPRWAMEETVRSCGIPYVIVQPSVLFGDGAEFVAALARLAKASPVVPAITSDHDLFQPIWIEDVVTVVQRALGDDALLGRTIAIGGPDHLKFKEVMQTILGAMGKKRLVVPLPLGIASVQASMMSFLPHPPLTAATLELFGFENATDLDSVEKNFGFVPRSFRQHLLENGVAG